MPNLFDSTNYPETEPHELVVGDRWAWKRTDLGADYDPDSYALSYEAVRHGDDEATISITAGESGTDYVVEVASATTDDYQSGTYSWTAFITRSSDSERIRVDRGTWLLRPDTADDATDPRSFSQRVLDAIRATIEGRATQAHSSYSIEGRAVTRMTPEELERWRGIYEHRVAAERNTERMRAGKPGTNRIQAKFTCG